MMGSFLRFAEISGFLDAMCGFLLPSLACYLDVVALRTNLAFFFFFFSCLMIYKRSTQNTNLYTCGTIIIQHVGKLCDLESVIIL